jgi:nucleoside-diphosphate-sugar epimerase
MHILITGATGYLGSKLLAKLLESPEQHHITIVKRSFSKLTRIKSIYPLIDSFNLDQKPLCDLFKNNHFDLIIHCATNYGRLSTPHSEMLESNLLLPLRLLELGADNGVKNFINTDTMLDKGINAYSLSKQQFREWLIYFSHSVNTTTILLEHFYGPHDDETKFATHIIRSLIHNVKSIPLTKGDQKRDFIFIDDVISAFTCILDNLNTNHVGYLEYQLGSGKSITIKDFVKLAKSISNNQITQLDFGLIPYRQNELMSVKVDTSPLEALGWKPQIELEEGLKRTFRDELAFLK